MSRSTDSIKIKSWAKKAKYLRSQLEDHKDIFHIYEKDFVKVLRLAVGNIRVQQDKKVLQRNIDAANKMSQSIEEIEKETELSPGEKDPKRSLYRKIALKTHPDRQGVLNHDSDVAAKNEERFKRAMNAHNEDDLSELLMIAHEIDLDPLDVGLSIRELSEIYSGIERKVSTEITDIEKSYIWVWGEASGNIAMRINLLDAYLRQTGHPPVDQAILRDIIEHHETRPDENIPASRQRKTGKRPKKLIR